MRGQGWLARTAERRVPRGGRPTDPLSLVHPVLLLCFCSPAVPLQLHAREGRRAQPLRLPEHRHRQQRPVRGAHAHAALPRWLLPRGWARMGTRSLCLLPAVCNAHVPCSPPILHFLLPSASACQGQPLLHGERVVHRGRLCQVRADAQGDCGQLHAAPAALYVRSRCLLLLPPNEPGCPPDRRQLLRLRPAPLGPPPASAVRRGSALNPKCTKVI